MLLIIYIESSLIGINLLLSFTVYLANPIVIIVEE